jgi:hypothetical protein
MRNILWMFAGVGKPAVTQTVAEPAKNEQTLGAAFFVLRQRGQMIWRDSSSPSPTSLLFRMSNTYKAWKGSYQLILTFSRGTWRHANC